MITQQQCDTVVERSVRMLKHAGIVITPAERERFEVADFGLGELDKTGLQILTYVNTERVCAKELSIASASNVPGASAPDGGRSVG